MLLFLPGGAKQRFHSLWNNYLPYRNANRKRHSAKNSATGQIADTLIYHVSHPLHQVDGVSHAARGKGVCHSGACDFLIAVPVKSFDSGDSNRDLHMLQVTRGAQNPMVTVRTHLPESSAAQSTIHADLDIEFAGQTAHFTDIAFLITTQGNEKKLTGTIPAKVSDFKIDPPTLLTMPIKNDIPVKVEMLWKQQ